MKPFMAIERRMTVWPACSPSSRSISSTACCGRWRDRGGPRSPPPIVAIVAAPAAVAPPSPSPVPHPNDTRSVVERVRAALDGRDAVDWYATFPGWAHYPPLTTIDGATDYVVLVQETAERFARFRRLCASARSRPALMPTPMTSCWRSRPSWWNRPRKFSYRNVPLRVVALRSNTARLDAVLAKSGRCRRRGSRSFRVVTGALGATARRRRCGVRPSAAWPHAVKPRRARSSRRQCHSRTSTKWPAIAAAAAIAGDTRWVRPL